MRTSKGAALVAAAAMALVAAVPVAAQEETAGAVKGSIEECLVIAQGTTTTGPAGSAETINQVWECQGQANDERLNGTISIVYPAELPPNIVLVPPEETEALVAE